MEPVPEHKRLTRVSAFYLRMYGCPGDACKSIGFLDPGGIDAVMVCTYGSLPDGSPAPMTMPGQRLDFEYPTRWRLLGHSGAAWYILAYDIADWDGAEQVLAQALEEIDH